MKTIKLGEPRIVAQDTEQPVLFGGYQDPTIRRGEDGTLYVRFNARRDADAVLVSCTEAARLCKVTRPTISVWIKEGRIHKRAIGQSVGIPLDEIRSITNPL